MNVNPKSSLFAMKGLLWKSKTEGLKVRFVSPPPKYVKESITAGSELR